MKLKKPIDKILQYYTMFINIVNIENYVKKKMKLSTKFRYGARAILEIAKGTKEEPVKRKTISMNEDIPDSYLKNILISLKEAGLIKAIRGAGGGYILSRNASDINFLHILVALEGNLSLVDCLDDPGVCKRVNKCATREIWKKMTTAQEEILHNITIKELLENETTKEITNYNI